MKVLIEEKTENSLIIITSKEMISKIARAAFTQISSHCKCKLTIHNGNISLKGGNIKEANKMYNKIKKEL